MRFNRELKRTLFLLTIIAFAGGLLSCGSNQKPGDRALLQISERALSDQSSLFYADFASYPDTLLQLPIGMFDSGTGGLTVMEQFLSLDCFDNVTGEQVADGLPDFEGEDFIYLADQANMPYGVYPSQGKQEYLRELVVRDALFLTTVPNRTKLVVIACNTATAYGLDDVRDLLQRSGTGVVTIGVIDAGVSGAMEVISKEEESFAVGVLATVGTIASQGYQNKLKEFAVSNGYKGKINIVAQGGLGFAEAVDSEPDYISYEAQNVRDNYRGPVVDDSTGIRLDLMPFYNFDTTGNALLVTKDSSGHIKEVQLNSAGNYARFHLVTLLQKHRETNPGVKMKSIILGCTHYPYLYDTLAKVVDELRSVSVDGSYVFGDLIAQDLVFVDPAINTAKEAYLFLRKNGLLEMESKGNNLNGFISVPHPGLPANVVDGSGNLLFDFKYGRDTGDESASVSIVPFSSQNINKENLSRIEQRLPYTYSLIKKNFCENEL